MPRFLRPDLIVRGTDVTWLIDEMWPVAAELVADRPPVLVTWPWPDPATGSEAQRVIVTDGVGLVIQVDRRVVWAGSGVSTTCAVPDGLVLAAADPEAAWLVDRTSVDPGLPPSPPPAILEGRIVMATRDGTSQQVITPAPAVDVVVDGMDVWVTLAGPLKARPGLGTSWHFRYPTAVWQLTRDQLLTEGLLSAVPSGEQMPASASSRRHTFTWLAHEPAWTRQHGIAAGGLRWDVGAPSNEDKINRRALAVGYSPESDTGPVKVDLGLGLVSDAQAVGDELWVAVARRRWLAVPHDHGTDVLAIAHTGAVRIVHRADSIDVSCNAPALRPAPNDRQIRDHVKKVRDSFADLDRYWSGPDGVTTPLSRGLTDGAVAVEDEWPNTRIVVTMRHVRRPGLVLRRTLSLFDERGNPVDHDYAAIKLMEDLDTDYLAPAEETVNGVLDT